MATYYNPRIITNNIEFSVDAANVKSWSGTTPAGTNYGYWGGGRLPSTVSTVDRTDYSNDTATASTKGPLTSAKYSMGATGNISYGYWAGGEPASTNDSNISRIDYSNDTATALSRGPLVNRIRDANKLCGGHDALPQ